MFQSYLWLGDAVPGAVGMALHDRLLRPQHAAPAEPAVQARLCRNNIWLTAVSRRHAACQCACDMSLHMKTGSCQASDALRTEQSLQVSGRSKQTPCS